MGVQNMALDVVEVQRGQLSSTHHAEQPACLCFVLHEELLAEPGVQRVVQIALQGLGRRPEGVLFLLFRLDRFLTLGAGGHAGRLELLFLQGPGRRRFCCILGIRRKSEKRSGLMSKLTLFADACKPKLALKKVRRSFQMLLKKHEVDTRWRQ